VFDGFTSRAIETSGATITVVHGGSGPPLLLLHGYPQTHVMWHKVAPLLMRHFTIVATDLRGYGDSSKPAGGPDHAAYSKRDHAPVVPLGAAPPRLPAIHPFAARRELVGDEDRRLRFEQVRLRREEFVVGRQRLSTEARRGEVGKRRVRRCQRCGAMIRPQALSFPVMALSRRTCGYVVQHSVR